MRGRKVCTMQISPLLSKITSAPQLFWLNLCSPKRLQRCGAALCLTSQDQSFLEDTWQWVCVVNQGFCLAALHSLSYTVYPDGLLQWGEKQPACLVCLLLKGLQNFPGKKVTSEASYRQRKALGPWSGNFSVIYIIFTLLLCWHVYNHN